MPASGKALRLSRGFTKMHMDEWEFGKNPFECGLVGLGRKEEER